MTSHSKILKISAAAAIALAICLLGIHRADAARKKLPGIMDAKFSTIGGKAVTLKTISRGKPVYLVFFASWCPVCIEEIPKNNAIFEKFPAKDITVVAVDIGDPPALVQRLVKAKGIKYPVYLDTHKSAGLVFGMNGLPLTLAIDPRGRIVYRSPAVPGDNVLKSLIEVTKATKAAKQKK